MMTIGIPRLKLRSGPGSRPGTVIARKDSPPPEIRVIRFGPDEIDDRDHVGVDELPGLIGKYPITWVNVNGLGDAEVIQKVGEIFGIHRLALEDVVNLHQRAKVEDYDDQLFVVARMVSMQPDGKGRPSRLQTEQLSLFLGEDFVLTWQERPGDCFDPVRQRLQVAGRPIRKSGADYFAYTLLDAVIDGYFPVLDQYGQRLDDLEDTVGASTSPQVMAEIHDVKSDLRGLRRAAWPHREAIQELMNEHGDLISEPTCVHLRDVYDHTLYILDVLEAYRETCSDLRDYYLSAVSNRMNEVMKVLTIIATIFIPLGFIAGLYGMNFDPAASPYNMPELHWFFGYPFALSTMFVVAIGMLYFFRAKGWIGGGK